MATGAQVAETFVRPIRAHCPKMPGDDSEVFLRSLSESLSPFSVETLSLAAQDIIRTRRFQTFPSVAECLGHCRRFEAVGPGSGASATSFDKQALGMIQAQGHGVALSPMREMDLPEWRAWKAYFAQTANAAWLRRMALTEKRQFSSSNEMTFPCRAPRDFDPAAPSAAQAAEIAEGASREAAARLCRSPLGERALANGWLSTLVGWAEEHGRLPDDGELDGLRDLVRQRREGIKAAVAAFGPRMENMRREFERRAARDVFGIEPPEDDTTFGPEDAVARGEEIAQRRSEAAYQRAEAAGERFRADPPKLSPALLKKFGIKEPADGEA